MRPLALCFVLCLAPLTALATSSAGGELAPLRLAAAPPPSLGTPPLLLLAEDGSMITPTEAMEERARLDALRAAAESAERAQLVRVHDERRSARIALGVPTSLLTMGAFGLVDLVIAGMVTAISRSDGAGLVTGVVLAPGIVAGGAGAIFLGGRWLDGRGSFGATYAAGVLAALVMVGGSVGLSYLGEDTASMLTALVGGPVVATTAMLISYESSSSDAIANLPRDAMGRDEPVGARVQFAAAPTEGGARAVALLTF